MKILASPYFRQKYKKLVKKNPRLSSNLDKQFSLLKANKNHPSLRLHKLSGKPNQWSISVTKSLRIIFQFVKEGIYAVDIGSHDEVY